mgnify:CR=1 FL=1
MKVYEKTLDKKPEDIVKIVEKQLGFQLSKSTVDAIFVLQQLQRKFEEKKKEMFHIFVDFREGF